MNMNVLTVSLFFVLSYMMLILEFYYILQVQPIYFAFFHFSCVLIVLIVLSSDKDKLKQKQEHFRSFTLRYTMKYLKICGA